MKFFMFTHEERIVKLKIPTSIKLPYPLHLSSLRSPVQKSEVRRVGVVKPMSRFTQSTKAHARKSPEQFTFRKAYLQMRV